MSTYKYMLITRPENWKKLKSDHNNVWPVSGRNSRLFNKFEVGDMLIVYLSQKSSFAGIIEVTGKLESPIKPILFMGDFYEYLLPVKYKVILEDDKLIPIKNLINDLDLTKDRINSYGSALQRAAKRISTSDFELIFSKIIDIAKHT